MKRFIYILFGLLLAVVTFVAVPKDVNAQEVIPQLVKAPEVVLQATVNPEEQISLALTAKALKLVGSRQGQCVIAVRNFLGVDRREIQGMAKSTRINSYKPTVGAIIVLKMSKLGHVGVVLNKTDTTVTYFDSNGDWKQRGAIRTININSAKIKGYRIINL